MSRFFNIRDLRSGQFYDLPLGESNHNLDMRSNSKVGLFMSCISFDAARREKDDGVGIVFLSFLDS